MAKKKPQTYTVKAGDSWAKIAGEIYGDQRMFEELMRGNKGVSMLRAGQTLVLPGKRKNPYVSDFGAAATGMATEFSAEGAALNRPDAPFAAPGQNVMNPWVMRNLQKNTGTATTAPTSGGTATAPTAPGAPGTMGGAAYSDALRGTTAASKPAGFKSSADFYAQQAQGTLPQQSANVAIPAFSPQTQPANGFSLPANLNASRPANQRVNINAPFNPANFQANAQQTSVGAQMFADIQKRWEEFLRGRRQGTYYTYQGGNAVQNPLYPTTANPTQGVFPQTMPAAGPTTGPTTQYPQQPQAQQAQAQPQPTINPAKQRSDAYSMTLSGAIMGVNPDGSYVMNPASTPPAVSLDDMVGMALYNGNSRAAVEEQLYRMGYQYDEATKAYVQPGAQYTGWGVAPNTTTGGGTITGPSTGLPEYRPPTYGNPQMPMTNRRGRIIDPRKRGGGGGGGSGGSFGGGTQGANIGANWRIG